jgi:hypothetical protein
MKEGFDLGLEMSGNSQAFADMVANMRFSSCGAEEPKT